MALRAIVTAGGTVEEIDDVRTVLAEEILGVNFGDETELQQLLRLEIANISGGEFGIRISHELAASGVETTLILRSTSARMLKPEECPFAIRTFTNTASLIEAIGREISQATPDVFFMAAAVSDYTPAEAVRGKISSDCDELTIYLKRNPKILPTIRHQVPNCFIVGFKLLSNVSDEVLERVGLRQIEAAGTDLCVANDVKKILWKEKIHPISIVHPDGSVKRLHDHRSAVANQLVKHVLSLRSYPH